MAPLDGPLTRDKIVSTAADMVRRFGPDKATVVDVARALGVSHATVYRHVATKAELRSLVVRRWLDDLMTPLRPIATGPGRALDRLRAFYDGLRDAKRERAVTDPELFTAYRALSAETVAVTEAHVEELVELTAAVLREGIAKGEVRKVDPVATARAVLFATARFHHPAHASEWCDPGNATAFEDVWALLVVSLTPRASDAPTASRP